MYSKFFMFNKRSWICSRSKAARLTCQNISLVGDGGEKLAGLKKLVKEKKCNQCKTTNKQKKWGYSTKWMPDG